MQPHAMVIDITDQIPDLSGPLLMSAWIFAPRDQAKGIVFCLGAKAYYHLIVPGHPEEDYSFALFMAERGWLVIAVDSLGVGESTHLAQETLTMTMLACANERALQQILVDLLHNGFDFHLPRIEYPSVTMCVGHGKGVMLAITQQARYRRYDALVVAGWSNNYQWSSPGGCEAAQQRQEGSSELLIDVMKPENFLVASCVLRPFLFDADAPSEGVITDESRSLNILRHLASPPHYALMQQFATLINVPLLLCMAEKDITDNLLAEATLYPWSPLVEMFLLRGSAHLHTIAGTRQSLWIHMDEWFHRLL